MAPAAMLPAASLRTPMIQGSVGWGALGGRRDGSLCLVSRHSRKLFFLFPEISLPPTDCPLTAHPVYFSVIPAVKL
jgi:hypothetical protein